MGYESEAGDAKECEGVINKQCKKGKGGGNGKFNAVQKGGIVNFAGKTYKVTLARSCVHGILFCYATIEPSTNIIKRDYFLNRAS